MQPLIPALSPHISRCHSNPEDPDIWFDAIDYVEMEETWFEGAEAFTPYKDHHTDPSFSAGDAADSRVPFTEDCRRCVQQLVRTLGEYGENKILSVCLSEILPGTPAPVIIAANSLYTAVTERRNIDTAVLHALGLVSGYLPENMNIVSRLAAIIRDTVTGWTDGTFLQPFLGNDDNHTSIHLFTALAVITIVARHRMKEEGTPQRNVLKVPAFMAAIFIRAGYYWTALGNMTGHLPSGPESAENTAELQHPPAFEVDTLAEMSGDRCQALTPCPPSALQLTAFSSNSTTNPERCFRGIVKNRPAMPEAINSLPPPEQVHYLAVDKLRQESGLSELLYCATRKTETRRQTNEKIVTNSYFNTKCDATVYPEPLKNTVNNIPAHTGEPGTPSSPSATSRRGGDTLLPLVVAGAAVTPVATSYVQALKSKTVIAAGTAMGVLGLTAGAKALWNSINPQTARNADSVIPDTEPLVQNKSAERENIIQDCNCRVKREQNSNNMAYNNFYLSNMPCQKEFQVMTAQPRNHAAAFNDITRSMNAILGQHNRQYDSIELLKNALTDQHGKILVRRIENALNEGMALINNAYKKFINPAEKDNILRYLSAALETDNKIALDEAYERLRRTAFQTTMLVKNNIHQAGFFERRDKNIPLPSTGNKSPMVLVNRKNPALIRINLENAENNIAELLALQSSAGYNPELMEAFMRQMIMLGGNTQDVITLPACQNEQGLSPGSYQRALLYFAMKNQPVQALGIKGAVYPDDNAVWDILNTHHNVTLTDAMREDAKNKLLNPQDEYYRRKTGKCDPARHEQQEIINAITWVYTGSERDFEMTKFFSDPVYRADIMTANTDSATIYLRDIGSEDSQNTHIKDSDNALFITFKQKAQELRNRFSDPAKVARNIAGNKVYERTGQNLDPDNIFLHQFTLSQTVKDTNSCTGYAHNGKPLHTETLTQAYMDNFNVFRKRQFSSFMDVLNKGAASSAGNGYIPDHMNNPELTAPFFTGPDKLSGLYLADAGSTHFGAENEVKYLPSDLKNDIYDANIMKQIEEQQQTFWRENSEEWRAMAKGQFIEEARLAYVNNTLSQQAYEIAIKGGAANIILYDPVTMSELNESAAAASSVKVSFLNVLTQSYSWSPTEPGPYQSFYKTNILCFTGKDGREVLYIPGNSNAFREFKDEKALKAWFEQQIKKEETRNAFLQHISLMDRQSEAEEALIELADSEIYDDCGMGDLKPTIIKRSIKTEYDTEDAFSALTLLTKERTKQDTDILISSNGEIALESFRQILQVVSMLAMPILPMFGPVGIALDMALITTQLGTGIGIMYTADTQDEYNVALTDVGMSLLFLGLNSISVISSTINAAPPATSFRHALLKTESTTLQKESGVLPRIQLIKEKGLSGRGAIMAGRKWPAWVKKPFGEDLNFRWIDDGIGETEKNLQKQLFSRGGSAAKLREFRQNPSGFCYEAMVESYNSLKNQGEQPKVIGLLIYKTPRDNAPSNHFAVVLKKDASDFVIDPTVRQFDPALPEEATILTLSEWKALMLNNVGVGKDSVVVLNTFDTPLLAKLNVAELHTAKGKYFQNSLIRKDNIIKHGDSFENSVIKEIRATKDTLHHLARGSEEYAYAGQDLERLIALKSHFVIFSPDEIKVTHLISSGFKKQILKYSVSAADIPALRSTGDARGITSTFSGKHYIKIKKNAWIHIEPSEDASFRIIFRGQKKLLMTFDEIKKKWHFPDLITNAKNRDTVHSIAVKPGRDTPGQRSSSANKNALPGTSGTRIAQPHINPYIADESHQGVLMINHHDLPENTHLAQIAMLGSHDAGTYAFNGFNSVGAIFPFAFKTQQINLKAQAMAGVKYFDIRIAERADGSFGFFHGSSVTGGNAVADVRDLLRYAKEDSKNFYILKFVFKKDRIKKGTVTTPSDKFLQQTLEGYHENMITRKDTPALSMAKVTLLNKHKNLAVMVHKYQGREPHWQYKQQVHTRWANHADAHKTADFILAFHGTPAPEDKLTIIQTNMPYASVENTEITLSVKKYLNKNADIIATAVDKIPGTGIISGDYIGMPVGASERFKTKINADNHKLLTPARR
ncbi:TPA: dermonecrotic toxin domain-containing protein [Morganella morganii]